MKKSIPFLMFLLTFTCQFAFGQKKEKPFAKVLYADQTITTPEYKVEISNILTVEGEAKFKFKITNTTADFLLFDASKCSFEINDTKLTPKDKFLVIEPFESKSKTISVLGTNLNTAKSYTFVLDGVQRIIPIEEEIKAPQFKLPASTNDFTAGKFTAQLKSSNKESGSAFVKFDIQYKGDKVGFIMPSKIDVTMPDGNNYANTDKKGKTLVLFPGDSEKFYAQWDKMPGGRLNDMQLVDMLINFNGVFKEGVKQDLAAQKVEITWNEEATKAAK